MALSPSFTEAQLLNALVITDTSAHTSSTSPHLGNYSSKVLWVTNGLNQSVSVQLQVSRDNSTFVNVGSATVVPASSTLPIDGATLAPLDKPYFYYRIVATCTTAPTSGNLSAWLDIA